MNDKQKLDRYLESEGFGLRTVQLKVVQGFNLTSEKIKATCATCPTRYFNIIIVYRWNDEFDLMELIHFSIRGRVDATKNATCLYVGSFPRDRYRTMACTFFAEDERFVEFYKQIYDKHLNKANSFAALDKDRFTHKHFDSWYHNANDFVKHDYDEAVELCNTINPHLCVDYPWFTYVPRKKTFLNKLRSLFK
jgi:hypothetical protein